MKKNNYFQLNNEIDYKKYLYSGFLGKLFHINHKLMEDYNFKPMEKILEIGAGFMPHVDYIKYEFKKYYCVDLASAKGLKYYMKKNYQNIIFKYYNGKNLKFKNNTFDRIIISHCLEHILEPEKFINEMLRVLKKNGIISIALPCDPGILWRLGRVFMKKIYLKNKMKKEYDHDYIIATEHINSIFNLYTIIKKKFNVVKENFYPLNFHIIDANLFYICHIKK
jgi:ubiquinone/menaquinone biosynthesis C-methylase UbiE